MEVGGGIRGVQRTARSKRLETHRVAHAKARPEVVASLTQGHPRLRVARVARRHPVGRAEQTPDVREPARIGQLGPSRWRSSENRTRSGGSPAGAAPDSVPPPVGCTDRPGVSPVLNCQPVPCQAASRPGRRRYPVLSPARSSPVAESHSVRRKNCSPRRKDRSAGSEREPTPLERPPRSVESGPDRGAPAR